MQYTVLLTGANRGLGLEFVKQYAEDGWKVLACCRQPSTATALTALAKQYPEHVSLYALDVADATQILALADELKDVAIDVLINNAGIYPHSEFGATDTEAWLNAFNINTIAPVKMAEAFVSHVARSQLKKIVSITSKMGSIDDNTSGGSYLYRTSKTALNMAVKSMSVDLRPYGIACMVLHPGWVRTEMGGPNGLIDAPESVSGLRQRIAELTLQNAGDFLAYDGRKILW